MFKTKTYVEHLKEQNARLIQENERLTKRKELFQSEIVRLKVDVHNLKVENNTKLNDLEVCRKEIVYLKQRNKELRQKTWFQVYEENLKLQEEIKQYQTVLKSVETFINQYSSEKKVSKECH